VGGVDLVVDQWTHVALTWGPGQRAPEIFQNGSLASTSACTLDEASLVASARDVFIGSFHQNGVPSGFWHGHIDEVRIWTVPRTAAQIQADMGRCSKAASPASSLTGTSKMRVAILPPTVLATATPRASGPRLVVTTPTRCGRSRCRSETAPNELHAERDVDRVRVLHTTEAARLELPPTAKLVGDTVRADVVVPPHGNQRIEIKVTYLVGR
jgi:hypothetical protein